MDEPTSGVDARETSIFMRAVRNIVDTERTVVCTVHHPSTHVFESFDKVKFKFVDYNVSLIYSFFKLLILIFFLRSLGPSSTNLRLVYGNNIGLN